MELTELERPMTPVQLKAETSWLGYEIKPATERFRKHTFSIDTSANSRTTTQLLLIDLI